jgi:hypothetical protein
MDGSFPRAGEYLAASKEWIREVTEYIRAALPWYEWAVGTESMTADNERAMWEWSAKRGQLTELINHSVPLISLFQEAMRELSAGVGSDEHRQRAFEVTADVRFQRSLEQRALKALPEAAFGLPGAYRVAAMRRLPGELRAAILRRA